MPACRDCVWFRWFGSVPACVLELPPSACRELRGLEGRACEKAVVLKHAPYEGKVLELGCGVWALPRMLTVGEWCGLDPRWGKDYPRGRNIVYGTAGKNPFPDGTFDWVLAFSTMEHWHEFGETVEAGLAETCRVLKSGGKFLATVPVYWHGDRCFLYGDLRRFRRLFDERWKLEVWEAWRLEHDPLPPFYGYRRKEAMLRRLGRLPVTYVLEVKAVKK